jgi:hypothetical protein
MQAIDRPVYLWYYRSETSGLEFLGFELPLKAQVVGNRFRDYYLLKDHFASVNLNRTPIFKTT